MVKFIYYNIEKEAMPAGSTLDRKQIHRELIIAARGISIPRAVLRASDNSAWSHVLEHIPTVVQRKVSAVRHFSSPRTTITF
jgi:hypothetical protein